MVCSDKKTEHTYAGHRVNHAKSSEYGLVEAKLEYHRDKAKDGHNYNVDFWMPEKPKNVLVHENVSSPQHIKKAGTKVPVDENHRHTGC